MAPKKRKASASWATECAELISAGDAAAVRAVASKLDKLQRGAQARLIELQESTGCGVRLIDSNQTQDQDVSYNMCSRCVTASFTAGPNAAEFEITFECEDIEGDQTIKVESDLFLFEDLKCGEVDDSEIAEFLRDAGLSNCVPDKCDEPADEDERRRWVYGDVVCEAVGLVLKKYGFQDSCGVELGMGAEDIYGWLSLDY